MNKKTIKNISKILRKTNNIHFAYIFGSRARNKMRYGSDLDIGVFFKNEPELLDIGMLVLELEKLVDCKVDLVSLNDLDKNNPKLAYSVLNDGILLFCEENKILSQFKRLTYISYFDFKPAIELFKRKFEERIANNKFAVREK